MTRVTWVLKVPCESPWVVDDFRHWNFSICSKNIVVMAVLMEWYKWKIQEKNGLLWKGPFFVPKRIKEKKGFGLRGDTIITVPKIIYYSRAFTWYLQNPRGMCHVSRNVSQSLSTFWSKISKNQSYLVWRSASVWILPFWYFFYFWGIGIQARKFCDRNNERTCI